MSVLDTLAQYEWLPDVMITLATCALLLGIYSMILQPQIRLQKRTVIKDQPCPDMWQYNEKTGMCQPTYETACLPFRAGEFETYHSQCEFAKRCGTNWAGLCP